MLEEVVPLEVLENNMFSVKEKREISDKIQQILKETNHPELPDREIKFHIHIEGSSNWSWADIKNNGCVVDPSTNPWNEKQDPKTSS